MATIESPHLDRSPRESWRDYRLLLILSAVVFVLDQLTKLWVVHGSGLRLGVYPPFGGIEVIPGVFSIVYAINEGAAWGLLSGYSWIFLIIATVALAAMFRYRRQLELERIPYQWAFGLMVGGIIGNALDRLLRGHVVDFLDVDLQFYRWPTFNVADSAIVVGTAWLIIFSQMESRRDQGPSKPNAS